MYVSADSTKNTTYWIRIMIMIRIRIRMTCRGTAICGTIYARHDNNDPQPTLSVNDRPGVAATVASASTAYESSGGGIGCPS